MRDRSKTIESLRRLAERPGTPEEGETARRQTRVSIPSPVFSAKVAYAFGEAWREAVAALCAVALLLAAVAFCFLYLFS